MQDTVLFVSHREKQCGVHEFGLEIAGQLEASRRFRFEYVECESLQELAAEVEALKPAALIFNHHPTTMAWGHGAAVAFSDLPTLAIVHDVTSEMADRWTSPFFSRLITHDPDLSTSNAKFLSAPRPLPLYKPSSAPPDSGPVRIGSFGFAAPDKGFQQIVATAQESFESCIIRLHIPFSGFGDADGVQARELVAQCRALITRPGVSLEAMHDFLSKEELLESLASNHINALFYDPDRGSGGISSASDLALASGRPMALRRGKMFRCFSQANPSIFIDDLSLREILANGTVPLQRFTSAWTREAVVSAYEAALQAAIEATQRGERATRVEMVRQLLESGEREVSESNRRMTAMYEATLFLQARVDAISAELRRVNELNKGTADLQPIVDSGGSAPIDAHCSDIDPISHPDRCTEFRLRHQAVMVPRFNTLLDDTARIHYGRAIAALHFAAPETMKRKIPQANIQQAFMISAVEALYEPRGSRRILCVGSFEDTACTALRALGYDLDEIDPQINVDLSEFLAKNPEKIGTYSVVFSTSVIEHVSDDEIFVKEMLDLTIPGGAIVLTCDFNNSWTPDQQKPSSNSRIYTMYDLERLQRAMGHVELIDRPDWLDHQPDFFISEFGGTMQYGFATLAVRKL